MLPLAACPALYLQKDLGGWLTRFCNTSARRDVICVNCTVVWTSRSVVCNICRSIYSQNQYSRHTIKVMRQQQKKYLLLFHYKLTQGFVASDIPNEVVQKKQAWRSLIGMGKPWATALVQGAFVYIQCFAIATRSRPLFSSSYPTQQRSCQPQLSAATQLLCTLPIPTCQIFPQHACTVAREETVPAKSDLVIAGSCLIAP